jgi:hypothetical protein
LHSGVGSDHLEDEELHLRPKVAELKLEAAPFILRQAKAPLANGEFQLFGGGAGILLMLFGFANFNGFLALPFAAIRMPLAVDSYHRQNQSCDEWQSGFQGRNERSQVRHRFDCHSFFLFRYFNDFKIKRRATNAKHFVGV